MDYCQSYASVASSELQRLVAERFHLSVSVSQLNHVRAAHNVRRVLPPREKKPKTGLVLPSGYHEQAGGLLLLATATESGLLTQLEQALPPAPDSPCLPLAASPAVRQRLVLTLLFLGAAGLQRTWDLRSYTADGLALLTGRTHAYGYRYTEAFLSQVARADGDERFTRMLGAFATHLWHPVEAAAEAECPHCLQALTCYVQASGIAELIAFVDGLNDDEEAVANGCSLIWSNGMLEDFVNKVKWIKRSSYGQAGFPLLQRRVLLHPTQKQACSSKATAEVA